MEPEPEIPPAPNDTTGVRFSLEFIDELERKRNPESHLRTVVRSNARKASFSRRRSLTAVNTRSMQLSPLRTLRTVVEFNKEVNVASFSEISGNATAPRENFFLTMLIREDGIRELPSVSESPHDPHNPKTKYSPIQSLEFGEDFLRQLQISPKTILGAGRIDPLNSYPIDSAEMQPYMHGLVDYHAFICDSGMPKDPDTGAYIHTKWLQLCMQNQMAFKSMLLAAEMSLRGHQGLTPWELLWGERSTYRNHLKGLKEMANFRGGLDQIPRPVKLIIIWIDQIGMDTILPSPDNGTTFTTFPEQEAAFATSSTSEGSMLKSSKLVEILKSIRFLTTTHIVAIPTNVVPSEDFRASCSIVQYQLEQLLAKTAPSILEDSCILAAIIYIDLILLDTPSVELIKTKVTRQLHEMIIPLRRAIELKENGDIVTWVSATASAIFGSRNNQKVGIIDKFKMALAVLEARILP
ncbi:hypothetical protein BGZ57DRAFT_930098 [Hyaloscypha finlandica]|nr:hypothetical protein BGZ57DRAFT_930098 [Hyaloscypha finlandica]